MNVKKMDCPYCGANLKIAPNATHCRCIYCGSDFQIDANVEMEHKTVVDSDGYITLENGDRVKPYHNYTTVQTDHQGESREYDFYYDHTGKMHWGAPPAEKLRRVKITVLSIIIAVVAFPILGLIWFVSDNSSDSASKAVYEEGFDPYSVIVVSADGVSGSAKLRVIFTQSGYASMGEWTASKETGLKNGDVVTIQFAPKAYPLLLPQKKGQCFLNLPGHSSLPGQLCCPQRQHLLSGFLILLRSFQVHLFQRLMWWLLPAYLCFLLRQSLSAAFRLL